MKIASKYLIVELTGKLMKNEEIKNRFGFLTAIKKKISDLINFQDKGDEYEQACIRLVIVTFLILYLFINLKTGEGAIPIFWLTYFCISVAMFLHIRIKNPSSEVRKLLCIFLDISATSYSIYLTRDISAIFIGVYLWIIVGNGLRYGKSYMIGAYVLSIAEFCFVAVVSSYWQGHILMFYGLLFTLIAVPLHTLRLFTRLQHAIELAEHANAAKSNFLSHVSHEIRTPLNGIIGACELIEESDIAKEKLGLFKGMKVSTNLLMSLINNVLDLSEIESGKIKTHIVSFNTKQFFNESIRQFQTRANKKNINLKLDLDDGLPSTLFGEQLLIQQVLTNLVGNAIKFTTNGQVRLSIRKVYKDDNEIKIRAEVTDTGIGIASAELATIFDSFSQANENIKASFGGTGLGTSISKKIIESLGGDIGVVSKVGEGSTFWFELVIPYEENVAYESSNIIKFEKTKEKKIGGYKILVAEDNSVNSQIITHALIKKNHTIDLVENGFQALDKLETERYDLLILDSNMPEMGGVEAFTLYKSLNVDRKTAPCILLSADANKESIKEAKEHGIEAYLTKPIDFELLENTINRLVGDQNKLGQVLQYPALVANGKDELVSLDRLKELKKVTQDKTFINVLIADYLKDTEQNFIDLGLHIEKLNYSEIRDSGHTMAGSASNMGATKLMSIFKEINDVTPLNGVDYINDLFNEANTCFAKTKTAMLRWREDNNQQVN